MNRSLPTKTFLLMLAAFAAVALLAMQACGPESSVGSLEQRAQALDREIMCPVCPGESIDQSQTEYAKQMRAFVREKLAEGWSEEKIKQYYVDRFGPRILMAPPREGFNLLAWLLPPLAVATGLAALAITVKQMRKRSLTGGGEVPGNEPLSEGEQQEYFRRIEAILEHSELSKPPVKEKDNG